MLCRAVPSFSPGRWLYLSGSNILLQKHLGTSRLQSPAAEGHDRNLCGGSVTWLLGTSMLRRSRGFGFKQGDLGEGLHTNSMIILTRLFFSRREGPMAQGCTAMLLTMHNGVPIDEESRLTVAEQVTSQLCENIL